MALKPEDLLSQNIRKTLLDEIKGSENTERKNEAFERYEIYHNRVEPILMREIKKEYSEDTVEDMRPVTSIALAPRVINELASVYRNTPEREFETLSDKPLSESEKKQLEEHYEYGKFNVKLKKANRFYELYGQCALYIVPKNGCLNLKPLSPFQYDVIPDPNSPEIAMGYILSVHDRSQFISNGSGGLAYDLANPPSYSRNTTRPYSDGNNQKIADADDYKKLAGQRFVWWTKEYNFMTNGHGEIIDPVTDAPATEITPEMILNPIAPMLPFVDIAVDKDSEFWVREGAGTTEFTIEFLRLMMDVFFIHKMQGYSQGIVYSEKPPANMKVGPNRVMHIPLDANKEIQPRFEFASPNVDMNASLELLENFLRLFMSSKGIEPKTISGKADGTKYNSGLERLLAMIERFEATSDTLDLFQWVERELVKLVVAWNNVMYPVTDASSTTEPFIPELRLSLLPEDTTVCVNFHRPEDVQTKAEKRDDVLAQLDNGLMSRSEAVMELRGISEEAAVEILQKIDGEQVMLKPVELSTDQMPPDGEAPEPMDEVQING